MIGAPFIGELVSDLIGIFGYLTVQVRLNAELLTSLSFKVHQANTMRLRPVFFAR